MPTHLPESGQALPQLAEAAHTILSATRLPDLWTAVINAIRTTLKPDAVAICYYAPDSLGQIDVYGYNISDRFLKRAASQPALWRKNQIITAPKEEEPANPTHYMLQQESLARATVFPFVAQDTLQGGILAGWQTAVSLTPDQLEAGRLVAQMAAATIQNINLFAAQARALQREQQLNEFSRTLNELQDLPSILSYVAEIATQLTDANRGKMGLIVGEQVMMFYPVNFPADAILRPLSRGQGLPWTLAESGQSLILNDYANHHQADPEIVAAGASAFLGVPILVWDDQCLGTINLFKTTPGHRFNQRDLELVESLARQTAVAIKNSRLYAEYEQRTSSLASALMRQEEMDRLKNLFVQNISHELRTPLGIIYGHAELLSSGALGELAHGQKDSIEIIARRAKMLTNLVNDLNALLAAETQEFRRELIDPVTLLSKLVDDYRLQAAEYELNITADLPEEAPFVHGDLTNLRRMFDNLMSNAFKFTPSGGTITLRLKTVDKNLHIEVSDTGIGIPAEHLHRIFERFYQVAGDLARPQGGTGLGLALVREIVNAHHGQITVESQQGAGTTFHIRLPAAG